MQVTKPFLRAVMAGGIVIVAAACGTSAARTASPNTTPPIVTAPSGGDAQDAWQKYATCMSKRAAVQVTLMPAPRFGVRIAAPWPPGQTPTAADRAAMDARLRAANAACRHFIKPFQTSSSSSQDEAKFRDGMLAYARCLRRHGVNVADPIIKKAGGGFDVSWPPTPGVTVGGARWNLADKSCKSLNPLVGNK